MTTDSKSTLTTTLDKAQARRQAYVKLVDQEYKLEDLFSDETITRYKKLGLKSLFLRTGTLSLDDGFGKIIGELTNNGIREILIFCNQGSKLTTEILNRFLNSHKIRINFRVVQISPSDTSAERELLSFVELSNNKISYQDGHKINLLNNDKSNSLIEEAYASHREALTNKHNFEVQEPKYIWQDAGDNSEKRQKTAKADLGAAPELEISTNIDFEIEVTAEAVVDKEQTIEVEIDSEQKKCSNNRTIAEEEGKRIFGTSSYEYYLIDSPKNQYPRKMPDIITAIFDSDDSIKEITCEALNLVVKHYHLFQQGVNTHNMPSGLGFKDNTIFVSGQRPSYMPENEFTVSLDTITPETSSPLSYSWLFFATKSGISLNDIYIKDQEDLKSNITGAPELAGFDNHPLATDSKLDFKAKDDWLDCPPTYALSSHYTISEPDAHGIIGIVKNVRSTRKGFDSDLKPSITLDGLPGAKFYNLLPQDRKRLDLIKKQLEERKILEAFNKIIESHYNNDGGFLLEEKTSIFLENLFNNILPATDSKKIKFFNDVLNDHNFQEQSDFATIFEGLDGCYKNFQTFLMREEKLSDREKKALEENLTKILNTQIITTSNFKVVGQRLVDLLDMSSKRGSLQEQVEYLLNSSISLLENPSHYKNAKNWFINAIHPSSALDVELHATYNTGLSLTKLKEQLNQPLFQKLQKIEDSLANSRHLLINSFRYLATILPHQRPSIDTYEEFFEDIYVAIDKPNQYSDDTYINEECPASYQLPWHHILSNYYITDDAPPALKRFMYKAEDHYRQTDFRTAEYVLSEVISNDPEGKNLVDKIKKFIDRINALIGTIRAIPRQDLNRLGKYLKSEEDFLIAQVLLAKPNEWAKTQARLKEKLSKEDSIIVLSLLNHLLNHTNDGFDDLPLLQELLKSISIEQKFSPCFVPTIVKADEDTNLVTGFTRKQAANNLKLLPLSILSSTGKYYNSQYPDQEFSAYVSLFNMLFQNVKVEDQQIGIRSNKAVKRYDTNMLYVKHPVSSLPLSEEVLEKEKTHEKMVNSFVKLFDKHPEFNFGQIVALGLVTIMYPAALAAEVISNAKLLLKYNEYFTQLLRILLSSVTKPHQGDSFSTLKARTLSIANKINFLAKEVKGQAIHELLTDKGNHPENLVFFALGFLQQETVIYKDITSLVEKLHTIDPVFKSSLLHGYANAKLPYNSGGMTKNLFPTISLDALRLYQNTTLTPLCALEPEFSLNSLLEAIDRIAVLPTLKESNLKKTRFNDIAVSAKTYAIVDLSPLANKHRLTLSESLLDKSFQHLKNLILQNDDFIKNVFYHKPEDEKKKSIAFDLILLLLTAIADHKNTKEEIERITSLLFDRSQSLKGQWLYVESNKLNIDKWLSACTTVHERQALIDTLTEISKISRSTTQEVLKFFAELDLEALQAKGQTISTLLASAPIEIITKYFDSFRFATKSFIQSNVGIPLRELYLYIQKISQVDDRASSVKKVLSYCINNKDYNLIDSLSHLDCKIDHMDQVIDWITGLTVKEIKILKNHAELNKLLKIPDVERIKIVADIAIRHQSHLSHSQYGIIATEIAKHDVYYARLLKSYLLFNSQAVDRKTVIKTVMDDIKSLSAVQNLFSNYNLERFQLDEKQARKKIGEIKHKNHAGTASLSDKNQDKLYGYVEYLMKEAKSYNQDNVNKLREKVAELKHKRMLLRGSDLEAKREIDLDYLALSFELLYREVGHFPRITQILTVLLMLIDNKHFIQELATGEGKGIIGALEAAYLWFIGQTVDVVSSSVELIERDLKLFSSFYDSLGIPHSNDIIRINSALGEYKIGGINYSTASYLSLFRANRDFYSKSNNFANHHVSLICDEIDATAITNPVNFKLAQPLMPLSPEETRALFSHILDFTTSKVFTHNSCSKKDDVANLILYLKHQFTNYSSSYTWPLSELQIKLLKLDQDNVAWYLLYSALSKCEKQDIEDVFDILLDSVLIAKNLRNGVDYVLLREDFDSNELKRATPIIKDQPAIGTIFGNGVQTFLHLLLERADVTSQLRFATPPTTATIFNISPTNFLFYYREYGDADSRILGLTATAGDPRELEEAKEIHKLSAFQIPRFNDDKKELVPERQFKNQEAQIEEVLRILQDEVDARPVIIFCDNPNEAETIYKALKKNNYTDRTTLCANSVSDTDNVKETLEKAGDEYKITITTPWLGRGIDFQTLNKLGFVAIIVCEDTTPCGLIQMDGRVARNGIPGKIYHLFNEQDFAKSGNITTHMDQISIHEHQTRTRHRPLTNILAFFQNFYKGETALAMACNKFLTQEWNKLCKEKAKSPTKKYYSDLTTSLVEIARNKYGNEVTTALEEYLIRLDKDCPNLTDQECINGDRTPTTIQYVEHNKTAYSLAITSSNYSPAAIAQQARAVPMEQVEIPVKGGNYGEYYADLYYAQQAVMFTHVFTIQNDGNVFTLPKAGNKGSFTVEGQGSGGSLMLEELKKSFSRYKNFAKSDLVDQISHIIDNYQSIQDLDLDRLEKGKWQAINIITAIDSESSHAESFVTNGELLFWVNRGAELQGKSGIKIYLIIKDMDEVKLALKNLIVAKSQPETRKIILELLKADPNDPNAPPYVLIEMDPQTIGNCGWTQTKGMVLASGLAIELGNLEELPDKTSVKFQRAVKNLGWVYRDFVNYDRITRLETLIASFDKKFKPQFLSKPELEEIHKSIQVLSTPIQPKVLLELKKAWEYKLYRSQGLKNTIYETQAFKIYDMLSLEIALHSSAGKALQEFYDDKATAKQFLLDYSSVTRGKFEQLDLIYNGIKGTLSRELLLQRIIQSMTKHSHHICNTDSFIQQVSQLTAKHHWEECVIADLEKNTKIVSPVVITEAKEVYYTYSSDNISEANVTNLHEAIRQNNLEEIRHYLSIPNDKAVSISLYRSDDYNTAVHKAFAYGNYEVISEIIQNISAEYLASVLKSKNDIGFTPPKFLLFRKDASQALDSVIRTCNSDQQKLYVLFNTEIISGYSLIPLIGLKNSKCTLGNVILEELPDNDAIRCQALTVLGYTRDAEESNDQSCNLIGLSETLANEDTF